jgi:hypothetical protein
MECTDHERRPMRVRMRVRGETAMHDASRMHRIVIHLESGPSPGWENSNVGTYTGEAKRDWPRM